MIDRCTRLINLSQVAKVGSALSDAMPTSKLMQMSVAVLEVVVNVGSN